MRTGTNHFVSMASAIRYYMDYGYDSDAVWEKVDRKEIVIGKPDLKPGQRLSINEEGRYVISD